MSHRRSSLLIGACGLALAAVAGVKFFTAEVHYVGDPTVSLAVRAVPSPVNRVLVASRDEMTGLYVVMSDENDYPGSGVYAAVVSNAWLVGGLALGALLLFVAGRASARAGRL